MKAIELFQSLEDGILRIITAADLYAIHLLANSRKEDADKQLIQSLLTANHVSTITVLGIPYTETERKELEKSGVLQGIGSQIVLATYTAFEYYLKNKFDEYFQFRMRAADGAIVEGVLRKFSRSFRSLEDMTKLYKDILDIHLPSFEIDKYFIGASSSFKPKSAWEGIKIIERARHDIAHKGKAKDYKVAILPDAWEPFEFLRRWVDSFDVNFNCLVYEDRATSIITEYREHVAVAKKNALSRA